MFTSSSESVGTTTFFSVILIPYRRAQHCFFSLFFHHSSNKAHTQQCHILALHFSVFTHCSNKAHTKQCYILAFHFSVFLHCSNKTHTQQCHILALHHTTESELTLKITSVLNRCHIVAAIKKKKTFRTRQAWGFVVVRPRENVLNLWSSNPRRVCAYLLGNPCTWEGRKITNLTELQLCVV